MKLLPNFMAGRPYIPESDFSGVVVDSNDSQDFKAGDEVFGWIMFSTSTSIPLLFDCRDLRTPGLQTPNA